MKKYEELLENKYRQLSLKKEGMLIIPLKHIDDFLKECESLNLAILGFEGFVVVGNNVVPRGEEIGDLSNIHGKTWAEHKTLTHKATADILKNVSDTSSFGYEFVLMDKEDFLKRKNSNE